MTVAMKLALSEYGAVLTIVLMLLAVETQADAFVAVWLVTPLIASLVAMVCWAIVSVSGYDERPYDTEGSLAIIVAVADLAVVPWGVGVVMALYTMAFTWAFG